MKYIKIVLIASILLLQSPWLALAQRTPQSGRNSNMNKTIVIDADETWMNKLIEAQTGKEKSKIIIIPDEAEEKTDYLIEELTINGDMAERQMKISGNGAVLSGRRGKIYLVCANPDILIKDLYVNGTKTLVAFDQEGYYFISPAEKFSFKGSLEIKDKTQIPLKAIGPINRVSFGLVHGYAVDGDKFGVVNQDIVLQRIYERTKPVLVKGVFRFSLADVNTFLYQLSFQSFGDIIGSYTLELPNGEQILSVDGAFKWEQKGSRLILDLTSTHAQLRINGTFMKIDEIRVPLRKGMHDVVIGADPQKKLNIETQAREKDLSEVNIDILYTNSRAFLASYQDKFKLQLLPLELIPSLAATSRQTQVTYAVNEQGSILSEMNCEYQNTGMDYLELDIAGTPLYAAMQGRPIKLTKEERLFLTFPKSKHGTFDLVSFATRRPLGWISFVRLPFPKIDVPITTRHTKMFYPPDFFSFTVFGAKGGSEMPGFKNMVLFLVLVSLLGGLLVKERRFVGWYMILAIGTFYFDIRLFVLLILVSLALIIRAYAGKIRFKKLFLVVVSIIVLALTVLLSLWLLKGLKMEKPYYATQRWVDQTISPREEALEDVPRFKGTAEIGEGPGAISIPTKKGVLPVKFELPNLGKSISVTNHLVTKEKSRKITVVLFSSRLKYILYIFMLIAAWMCYKIYIKKVSVKTLR